MLLGAHPQNSLGGQRNPKWGLTMRIWEASSILPQEDTSNRFCGFGPGIDNDHCEARCEVSSPSCGTPSFQRGIPALAYDRAVL